MSIQTSLSRWLAVQILVGLSLVCAAVYGATRWSFHLKQEEEFQRHVGSIRHVVLETTRPLNAEALRRKLDDYFLSHADAAVSIWSGSRELYLPGIQPQGPQWQTRSLLMPEVLVEGQPLRLRMSIDVGSDEALLMRLAWTLVGAAALGTVLVSATASWLVRRGLRPLKKLAADTAAAGPEQPGRRIDPQGYAAELQPWIAQFNALLGRAEGAYAQQEAFNADVAHELRTPLSNMIAQLEIELGRDRTAAEFQNTLESQLEEARRLSAIVSDMLFLSKVDRGMQARRGQAQSLAREVEAVAEFQEAALEDAGLSLVVDGEERLPMDSGLVRRAISNLVSNAKRYARRGSTIRVAIERSGDEVSLAVENLGADIDASELPRLFERFYRADQARAGSASHHGLGLAIVAAIARMHGGRTFAASRNGLTRIGLTLRDPGAGEQG